VGSVAIFKTPTRKPRSGVGARSRATAEINRAIPSARPRRSSPPLNGTIRRSGCLSAPSHTSRWGRNSPPSKRNMTRLRRSRAARTIRREAKAGGSVMESSSRGVKGPRNTCVLDSLWRHSPGRFTGGLRASCAGSLPDASPSGRRDTCAQHVLLRQTQMVAPRRARIFGRADAQ
jgi:hypothetical protein